MTHICVGKLTIIGSDNGLSPGRRQAIIWTNAGTLLIGPLGTNFSEILIEILTFSFKKMRFKVPSAKRRPFCLGLNELRCAFYTCGCVCAYDSIILVWKLEYCSRNKSIPWLLMVRLLVSPSGHQQPWYWIYKIAVFHEVVHQLHAPLSIEKW